MACKSKEKKYGRKYHAVGGRCLTARQYARHKRKEGKKK